MASISLTKVIEKFKWENLTPEIDISKIKVTQPDINRPALQLNILRPRVCRSWDLWNIPT